MRNTKKTMNRFVFFSGLIMSYCWLYLAVFFNLWYPSPKAMREAWYARYLIFIHLFAQYSGFTGKIRCTADALDKRKWGLVIANHSSILDNLVLALLFRENGLTWNDMRTVSRISRKRIQNKVLRLFDSLLLNKEIAHDVQEFAQILPKWRAAGPLQIILYPEGTIYTGEGITAAQSSYLTGLHVDPYTHVVFPSNGIFEMLIDRVAPDYVYDVSIIYKCNGRRLIGEKDILLNIHRDGVEIIVELKRDERSALNRNWLYRTWGAKDAWLNAALNQHVL